MALILITDANGNLQAPTIPENVYQGSNNANQIVLLSPLPQSNTATVAFRLPNGLLTSEYLMTPYADVPSEFNLNGWVVSIDSDITALYGKVDYQVKLTNSQNLIIANLMGTFNVLRGVAAISTSQPSSNSWQQVINYLSSINSDIENGWLVSKGILPYDSTYNYDYNVSVYDKETNTIYTSLIADNLGNALTDNTKWSATALVTQSNLTSAIDTHNTNINAHNGRITTNENNISSLQTNLSNLQTNLQNNYYTKANTYSKNEVDTLIDELSGIQIKNIEPNLIIYATAETVQSVATQYIITNYDRQPQEWDALIITMTDQQNDKILYLYSVSSQQWINVGINNIDLSEVDLSSLNSFNLTIGEEIVTYDTTDGVTVNANGQLVYGTTNKVHTFESEFNIPMIAGSGISIDANQTNDKVEIKAVAEYITFNVPQTATQGTITNQELQELQNNENVQIMFNNELYKLNTQGHLAGYITYTCIEYENNVAKIKTITINVNNLSWVLNSVDVASVDYVQGLIGTVSTILGETEDLGV